MSKCSSIALRALLLGASASAFLPAPGLAQPTRSEADAIQRDLGLQRCDWRAGISTVDSAWARIEADPAQCAAVSTLNTLASYDGNRWAGAAWAASIEDLCLRDARVPEAVAGDLGLCVGPPPPTAVIACDKRAGDGNAFRSAPRRCRIERR